MKSSELIAKRLDEWAGVFPGPSGNPLEWKLKPSVFRGMNDLDKAKLYAKEVSEFFHPYDPGKPVFVVRGPTSTTRCKYEVVNACCGYSVIFRAVFVSDPVVLAQEMPREMYDLFAVNRATKRGVKMNKTPLTSRQGLTMIGKLTQYRWRTLELRDAEPMTVTSPAAG